MSALFAADGRYVVRGANAPAAVIDAPDSGEVLRVDIVVADGRIEAVLPAGEADAALPGHDADAGLMLPAFVDIHTHLDKGHIWPRKPNPDGSWMGALLAVHDDREARWSARDVERRMDFSLRCAYAHGTAAIRTHLDSVPPQQEITWDVFDVVRERWRGRIELQGVSLCGPDQMIDRATIRMLARRAAASGGVLGGAMSVFPEARQAMLNTLEAAGDYGLDVDAHCDETAEVESGALMALAEAVIETGFTGKVTAGHCCVVAVQDDITRHRTIERVVEAGIAIVSLPMCNMYLQDRNNAQGVVTPRWRGVAPLNEFKAAGAPVAISSDNTRDPFYAYGDLDCVEVFREGARILQFDHPADEAWTWARAVGADPAAFGRFDYTAMLTPGAAADFVLFRARAWGELMARPQADRIVVRGGVAIDRTLPDYRELDDLMGAA